MQVAVKLYMTHVLPRMLTRVDAKEDVKDFRPLRPGLDPSEIIVLFLCPERAFHRSSPHSGKFQHHVVQQLIVCQWACRIYYHVAEYLNLK